MASRWGSRASGRRGHVRVAPAASEGATASETAPTTPPGQGRPVPPGDDVVHHPDDRCVEARQPERSKGVNTVGHDDVGTARSLPDSPCRPRGPEPGTPRRGRARPTRKLEVRDRDDTQAVAAETAGQRAIGNGSVDGPIRAPSGVEQPNENDLGATDETRRGHCHELALGRRADHVARHSTEVIIRTGGSRAARVRRRRADRPRVPPPPGSVGRGATGLLIGRTVSAIAGWAGTVVIARELSPADWGGYRSSSACSESSVWS